MPFTLAYSLETISFLYSPYLAILKSSLVLYCVKNKNLVKIHFFWSIWSPKSIFLIWLLNTSCAINSYLAIHFSYFPSLFMFDILINHDILVLVSLNVNHPLMQDQVILFKSCLFCHFLFHRSFLNSILFCMLFASYQNKCTDHLGIEHLQIVHKIWLVT